MNNATNIADFVRAHFPEVEIAIDASDSPDGKTWIDLKRNGRMMVIECRPQMGFGLYHGDEKGEVGFGPDEIHRELGLLLSRLNTLLPLMGQEYRKTTESGRSAETENLALASEGTPQFGKMTLRDVRELLDVTQAQIAEALGKQQSAVSKIEQRGDMLLSTLVSVIHSLGGNLEIKAHFKDCDLPIYTNGRPASIQPHPKIYDETKRNGR